MTLTISDAGGVFRLPQQTPPVTAFPLQTPSLYAPNGGYRPDTSYHPQVAALGGNGPLPQCSATPRPYGPGEFSSYVSGTQARELDVDFMRMSYATYKDGPQSVCGWTEVSQQQLETMGWNPDVRLDVPGSQFRAMVFTDGQGNYVLAYRGTQAEGDMLTDPDWQTNYGQSAGLQTDEFDRLAPQVAQEFKDTLATRGDDGAVNNLAITGHSQGGGLATVGSAITGIPAVTFDASGVHPDTFERLGLDMDAVRQDASAGQIRRYSMYEDLLTVAQESFPVTSPALPEALGAPIVVKPEGDLDASMVQRAMEYAGKPWLGPIIDRVPVVRDLVRAAISHEQQLMIDTMLQQRPWEPGYQNPTRPDFDDYLASVPPELREEYRQNLIDFTQDAMQLLTGDVAEGDKVEALFGLIGDLGEGFWNSVGDTANYALDQAATRVDAGSAGAADRVRDAGDDGKAFLNGVGDNLDAAIDDAGERVEGDARQTADWIRGQGLGGFGDFAGGVVEGGGRLLAGGIDLVGDGVETLADGAGTFVDGALELTGGLIEGGGDLLAGGIDLVGDGIEIASDVTGQVVESVSDFVGDVGQGISDGVSWLRDRF